MAEEEIKLIPYEKTLYDLLINAAKGKYFQNTLVPHLIAQIPEKNNFNIHYINRRELSVWFPLEERGGSISLDEFGRYVLISEEQFNKYKMDNQDLSRILLAPKNSTAIRESNKPNLSEQQGVFIEKPKKRDSIKDFNLTSYFCKKG
jgi:hypothetical protein